MFGEPALTSVAGLAFETVDEVDHVVDATARAGADAASGDAMARLVFLVSVPPTRTAMRCWAMKPPPDTMQRDRKML